MKSTSCFLTACIVCSVLPLMVQGAENMERHPGKTPKVKSRLSIPLVVIEIQPEIIDLIFADDLGKVTVELQQTSGLPVFNQTVDTSIQNQMSLIVSTNTYILTVATVDGTILLEETIVIP